MHVYCMQCMWVGMQASDWFLDWSKFFKGDMFWVPMSIGFGFIKMLAWWTLISRDQW